MILPSDERCWMWGGPPASVGELLAALPSGVDAVVVGGEGGTAVEHIVAEFRAGRVDALVTTAPVTEAVKLVAGGLVERTIDRGVLVSARTPQVIRRSALEALPPDTQRGEVAALLALRGFSVVAYDL